MRSQTTYFFAARQTESMVLFAPSRKRLSSKDWGVEPEVAEGRPQSLSVTGPVTKALSGFPLVIEDFTNRFELGKYRVHHRSLPSN